MERDETHGGDDNGLNKQPWRCCACRSSKPHRCYKCFCGKCPPNPKKAKEPISGSEPPESSPENGDIQITDTNPEQQSVETSDIHTGDEHRSGLPPNPVTSGTGARDGSSGAISSNSPAEVGLCSRPSTVKEQRGNGEVGNSELTTNEVDGKSSKSQAASTSNWGILAAERPEASGNQGDGANTAGSGSTRDTLLANEARGKGAGKGTGSVQEASGNGWGNTSGLGTGSSQGASGNQGGGDNTAGSGSTRDTLLASEARGKGAEWGTGSVQEASGNGWDNTSGWGTGSSQGASGNQRGWANTAGSGSTRNTLLVNEARGKNAGWGTGSVQETSGNGWGNTSGWGTSWGTGSSQGTSGNQTGRNNTSGWGSWGACPVNNEPKDSDAGLGTRSPRGASGNQRRWGNQPVNNKPRGNAAGPNSRRVAWRAIEPRGKQGVANYRTEDRSRRSSSRFSPPRSKSRLNPDAARDPRASGNRRLEKNAGSVSNSDTRHVNERRGNREAMTDRGRDRYSRSVSPVPRVQSHAGKRSRGDQEVMTNNTEAETSGPLKKPRENQMVVANSAEDESSKAVLLKPHVESGSTRPPCTEKESRGKQEVVAYKDGSGKSVSRNPPSGSNSRRDALDLKDPKENPEVTTYRAGGESSKKPSEELRSNGKKRVVYGAENKSSILPNLNAGRSSTLPALTVTEQTGRLVSRKEPVQVGQHDDPAVANPRQEKPPAVANPRQEKPPSVAILGERCSSSKKKLNSVETDTPGGPVKEVVWSGTFEVLNLPADERIYGIYLAHMAAKVNVKAYNLAKQISGNMHFKMYPLGAFMPETFKISRPDSRDIALYFYPQEDKSSKKKYKDLLKLLEKQGSMLRCVMGHVELLVFSSKLLTPDTRLYEGNYYMWGVFHKFRSDKVGCSASASAMVVPTAQQTIQNSA